MASGALVGTNAEPLGRAKGKALRVLGGSDHPPACANKD